MQFLRVKKIRREIACCDWNLIRSNLTHDPNLQNDYRTDWAAHHSYFSGERYHLQQTLKHALGLEVRIIEQGIGL